MQNSYPALYELIKFLARLIPDPNRAKLILMAINSDVCNIDLGYITLTGAPIEFWLEIVMYVNNQDCLPELIEVCIQQFPKHKATLQGLLAAIQSKTLQMPLLSKDWKSPVNSTSQLENVTGPQPTFLPISFLEIGLLRAKSVVLVKLPNGLGTGFLIQNDLLITNNHVIPNYEDAKSAVICFNYELTADGNYTPIEEFRLDPDVAFATSPSEDGDDWTAVHIMGKPSSRWPILNLSNKGVKVNDFVNIIQHPGGQPKQIALYHNIVTFVDSDNDSRIQYLTDTMPGSSGSPVFDSNWNIVAIHHSSGLTPKFDIERVSYGNEGIHVNALIQGLKANNLL